MFAQNSFNNANSMFDLGVGVKLQIEIGRKFGNHPFKIKNYYPVGYKLSITGAIGYYTKNDIDFFTALHGGLLLFNKNSIGANQSKIAKNIQAHFFVNTIATLKLDKKDFTYLDRNVPFYHFTEFTANPLQNPFKSSVSYGINWIFLQENKRQRIGFLNVNIASRVQVSYYNDGGPITNFVADKRDRYYTGGLVISYHGEFKDKIDFIELSYHKYTGYQKYAFDVSDKLQLDFLNYKNTDQFAYNQQRWRLNVSNTNSGYGSSISIYNLNSIDLQDFLHFKTNVPYHPNYTRGYRIMLGGRYAYNRINISK